MPLKSEGWAKLAAFYAGIVFGIYWIPLRALESAGISGLWSIVALNALPVAITVPVVLYRWRRFIFARLRFHLCGVLLGATFFLYAASFLYTDVVRAILLFYMTPIWGFLLARIVIGDKITPVRWLSIVLGAFGMLVIFGADAGLPWPRNIGDWMALTASVTWAIASLLLLTDRKGHALDYGLSFFFWATLFAGLAAWWGTTHGTMPAADWSAFGAALPWLAPVAALVILPGGIATVYGPTKLNPGVVGLLFMSEVSVATVTAALFSGEPFGMRELVGVLAISLAGLLEPLAGLIWRKSRAV